MKQEQITLEQWIKQLFNEYKEAATGDENKPVPFKRIKSLENHPTKVYAWELIQMVQYTGAKIPSNLQ